MAVGTGYPSHLLDMPCSFRVWERVLLRHSLQVLSGVTTARFNYKLLWCPHSRLLQVAKIEITCRGMDCTTLILSVKSAMLAKIICVLVGDTLHLDRYHLLV